MKMKYLIIVSLILAILTIGVVSASDDISTDDLATDDEGVDSISESGGTDEINENEPSIFISDEVFSDDEDEEIGAVRDNGGSIDGTITLLIDNTIYYNESFSSQDNEINIHIDDVAIPDNLKTGNHFVILNYFKNGVSTPFTLNKTVEFKYNPDIDWETDEIYQNETAKLNIETLSGKSGVATLYYDDDGSLGDVVTSANISNGKATLLVSGLTKGYYEFILKMDIDGQDYTKYPSIVVKDGDNPLMVTIEDEVNMDSDDRLADVYLDIGYFNGVITLLIDNIQYFSKLYDEDDGDYHQSIYMDDLKLSDFFKGGNHTVVVKYLKNGASNPFTLNKTVQFKYRPVVSYRDILVGETAVINIKYSSGSSGNATLYNYDDDEDIIGNKVASSTISNGQATILLPGLDKGYHYYFLNVTIGSQEFTYYPEIEVGEPYIYIWDTFHTSDDEDEIVEFEDYGYINGTITLFIDNSPYFTKTISSFDKKVSASIYIDDLNLPDSLKTGNHTVSFRYLKNGVTNPYTENRTVIFKYDPIINYNSISVGDSAIINIEYLSGTSGFATLYRYYEYNETVGSMIANVSISNGRAVIVVPGLAKGEYEFLLNMTIESNKFKNYPTIEVRENSDGFSASLSSSTIYQGNNLVVNVNGPKTEDYVYISVDGKDVKGCSLKYGAISESISGLSLGSHSINVLFNDGFIDGRFYSKNFNVNVVRPEIPTLDLKKVKVKRSAKKLILTATLKINGNPASGKTVTFKFNKKTFAAKTDSSGVAKVIIKKSVLKKLKAGKKVTYQASYLTKVVKQSVKVKK